MHPVAMESCSNCARECGPGSAAGLCHRCYQYRRRTDALPPPELLQAKRPRLSLKVRLDGPTLRKAQKLADAAGLTLGAWARKVLTSATEEG